MKKYFNTILIASILLLIFPFLAFPELWENIYVSILAFIIAYTSMLLQHKTKRSDEHGDEDEASLQEYVQELKERFQVREENLKGKKKGKRVLDIVIDEK